MDALRSNNFNTIRLLLAGIVVLFHVLVLPDIPELTAVGRHIPSLLGVQGFFVVSGFLVVMSYESNNSLWTYATRRTRRILPAYICVVLVSAVGLSLLSTSAPSAYFSSLEFWKYVAANLLFMNFLAPDLPGVFGSNPMSAVDGSLWTIKIELAFYCMVPPMVFFARRLGHRPVLLLLFILSIAWRVGFEYLGQRSGQSFYGKLAIQAPGQLSFFVVGAFLYYTVKGSRFAPNFLVAALSVAAYLMSTGLLFHFVAPIAVGLVLYWVGFGAKGIPDLGAKGDFSYGVYLYHWPVIQTMIALGLFKWNPYAGVIVSIAVSAAAAVLSWFAIERNFLTSKPRRALHPVPEEASRA